MGIDDKLIASQARRIAELEQRCTDYADVIRKVRMQIIGIGGPLNDNVLQYSHKQFSPFHTILLLTDQVTP